MPRPNMQLWQNTDQPKLLALYNENIRPQAIHHANAILLAAADCHQIRFAIQHQSHQALKLAVAKVLSKDIDHSAIAFLSKTELIPISMIAPLLRPRLHTPALPELDSVRQTD
ncbi:hypothetical protein QR66_18790 [Chromobacterium piscinae]|nr:hypothetical protein QR66_18790 [Chromobacterium piscinae]